MITYILYVYIGTIQETARPRVLLKFGQSEKGKVLEIVLGRLEHHGVARFGAEPGSIVATDLRQVGQHARLSVVGEIRRTREEFVQRHVGPVFAGEAEGNFVHGRRTAVATESGLVKRQNW